MSTQTLTRREARVPVPTSPRRTRSAALRPAVDIYQSPEAFLLIADMPGVTQETLRVELLNNQLTLSGETVSLYQGGPNATYKRTFRIPQSIFVDAIKAELNDGTLSVTLPKLPEAQPRQIPIQ